MFHEMRRKKQLLSAEESSAVLDRGMSGVLALAGDDDYPYAVPLSYVYDGAKLFFHCAKSGHKLDAIKQNNKASFCVIDQDQVISDEYTTYFRSVIVFGQMRILEDDQEKRAAIEKLAIKYAPHHDAVRRKNIIDKEWGPLCMLEMTIDHMTGKESIELIRNKQSTDI